MICLRITITFASVISPKDNKDIFDEPYQSKGPEYEADGTIDILTDTIVILCIELDEFEDGREHVDERRSNVALRVNNAK